MNQRDQIYSLTQYGEDLVIAMPDRKAVAAVKCKYAKLKKKQRTKLAPIPEERL